MEQQQWLNIHYFSIIFITFSTIMKLYFRDPLSLYYGFVAVIILFVSLWGLKKTKTNSPSTS